VALVEAVPLARRDAALVVAVVVVVALVGLLLLLGLLGLLVALLLLPPVYGMVVVYWYWYR
jgi:hypothetical protein